jgi:hypothetical protein
MLQIVASILPNGYMRAGHRNLLYRHRDVQRDSFIYWKNTMAAAVAGSPMWRALNR